MGRRSAPACEEDGSPAGGRPLACRRTVSLPRRYLTSSILPNTSSPPACTR